MCIPYGSSYIKTADFVSNADKARASTDLLTVAFTSIGFLLSADVPETSNIYNAINFFRLFYWITIVPSLLIIVFIGIELVRGV
jgi:hypothetical protein